MLTSLGLSFPDAICMKVEDVLHQLNNKITARKQSSTAVLLRRGDTQNSREYGCELDPSSAKPLGLLLTLLY